LLAFLLVKSDPQVVGLNLVAPEDNQVTLKTYETQMRQLGYLAKRRGTVPVTLHAGELWLGLVHPRYLRSHIRQAVELAGARRIGHGVSIGYEDHAEQLLTEMAKQNILVEINLTSNDQILGVTGNEHPFNTYRKYGVPLTLSTDDEGVSRGSLTHEYERAVRNYNLQYEEIVALSRNALNYAFLPGKSLWADPHSYRPVPACSGQDIGGPSSDQACSDFLAKNEKARLQWRLESQLAAFNADPSGLERE
jgi:adenosine deaminase